MSPRFQPLTLPPQTLELLQEQLADAYAETSDPIHRGVFDRARLESASQRPLTSMGSTYKYTDPYQAAAALGHSIVHNHPFYDGNKRSALLSMLAVLDRCNIGVEASSREAFEFMLRVTRHELDGQAGRSGELRAEPDREVALMADWLRSNSRRTPGGERQLTYRELRHTLATFGVEEHVQPGNRVDFTRTTEDGRAIRVQIGFNGRLSMTVEPGTVRHVRTGLELDEEHGVDHLRFYEAAPPLNQFLLEFREALDALAEYDHSGRRPD
jgi:death-on-curing protein